MKERKSQNRRFKSCKSELLLCVAVPKLGIKIQLDYFSLILLRYVSLVKSYCPIKYLLCAKATIIIICYSVSKPRGLPRWKLNSLNEHLTNELMCFQMGSIRSCPGEFRCLSDQDRAALKLEI